MRIARCGGAGSVKQGRFITLILGLVLFPVTAAACLWDSDTLRAEARGLPGLVELLTGRFEREPTLYYEVRLSRVTSQVDDTPDDLALYDDAAVACDRLGRCDDAIEWMARKRQRMDSMPETARGDHEYRYAANLGTFHAHRWLGAGADRNDLADLVLARDLIARAIEINPEAHFGREKYQLMAIEWLIEPVQGMGSREHPEMGSVFDRAIGYRGGTFYDLKNAGIDPKDAVEGLSGLVGLGAAWESIDLLYSLSLALEATDNHAAAHLARLRCIELAESGRRSLDPESPDSAGIAEALRAHSSASLVADDTAAFFVRAREAADAWKAHRDDFMIARLQQGRHPDTDPTFWAGYVEAKAPALPNGFLGLAGYRLMGAIAAAAVIGVALAVAAVITWAVIKSRRRAQRAAIAALPGA